MKLKEAQLTAWKNMSQFLEVFQPVSNKIEWNHLEFCHKILKQKRKSNQDPQVVRGLFFKKEATQCNNQLVQYNFGKVDC